MQIIKALLYIQLKTHHPKAGATKASNIRTVFRWSLGVLRRQCRCNEREQDIPPQIYRYQVQIH